jgi:hypothetical protein
MVERVALLRGVAQAARIARDAERETGGVTADFGGGVW